MRNIYVHENVFTYVHKNVYENVYREIFNQYQIPIIRRSPIHAMDSDEGLLCDSRVSDQLSDRLIFGRLFQANEKFSTFRSCANL